MRLHRLVLRSFGPFPGTSEIDLEQLGEAGLFLIHGATGAGKTSVLDAICFALYADVPGARSRASLRSDHAPASAVPEVELELTASGRRLRIRRSPEFWRAKKRGEGMVKVQASACLDEWTGDAWVNRGTRMDEVGLVVKDVLGMDLEQFVTVVLLPQGEFAAFLRAAPERRRELLERLFDTRLFARVEDWLAERRREALGAAVAAQEALARLLVRVRDVVATVEGWAGSGSDDGGAPLDRLAPHQAAAAVVSLDQWISREATSALAEVELAVVAAGVAESASYAGRTVARSKQVAAEVSAELAAVDAERGSYDRARQELAAAEGAAAVMGYLDRADHADQRLAETSAAVASASASLVGLSGMRDVPASGEGGPVAPSAAVGALLDALVGASPMLEAAKSDAVRAREERDSATRLADEHRRASDDLQVQRQRLSTIRDELDAVVAQHERERALAAQLPEHAAHVRSLRRALALLHDLVAAAAEAALLEAQVQSRRDGWITAREHLVSLQERRIDGMAAELAARLVAGEPCAVCGSELHPAPAARNTTHVGTVEVDQASAGVDVAAGALRSSEQRQTEVRISASSTRSELAALELPGLPLPELGRIDATVQVSGTDNWDGAEVTVAARAEAAERLRVECSLAADAALGTAARAADLATTVQHLGEQLIMATARADRSALLEGEARRRADTAVSSALASLEEHAASCPCVATSPAAAGDEAAPTILDRLVEVARTHDWTEAMLRTWFDAAREHGFAVGEAEAAWTRLDEALEAQDHASAVEVRAAWLPAHEVERRRALLDAVDRRRTAAATLLAQPDVVAATALPEPDVARLDAEHRARVADLEATRTRHTLLEHASQQVHLLSAQVTAAVAAVLPAEAERAMVQELADCVAGTGADNALRMRLSSYVLAARLEEIVALANERLLRLSDGRFTMQHTDGPAGRGARSGLGLRVLDAWTGVRRDTSSLSGGEAFLASLALALGLGDAVRAEAGGFDLQTLFVDEGFGSLDEDSLEQVLGVLDDLREGGRTVGIVSHVAELRLRIPAQLEVRRTTEGSTLAILTDGIQVGAA